MLPLEDSWKLELVKKHAELKMLDKGREKSPYVGANLQTSRSPSAIDHHCKSSYDKARGKLHSSRAKVRFYVAGENNHSAIYAVSPQRFSSFDKLLGSLMKTPLCVKEKEKERCIFSLDGSHKITSLDELTPGESYVCATYEVFEQLNVERDRPMTTIQKYRNAALAAARPNHTSQSTRSRGSRILDDETIKEVVSDEAAFITEIKPRLITVLRGGFRPRKSVRILLNKKNTRSFEQVISGIGDILCPGEPIKRLFSLSGRLVMCLADFYLEDNVFFAYSNDKMNPDDLSLDVTENKLVGAYRFRTASAYGRVTLTSHQIGVTNNKPRSIPASALPDVYRISSEPRATSRARSTYQSHPGTPHEKHSSEVMEKATKYPTSAPQEQAQRPESPASIKTQSARSEKSKQSIELSPTRSSKPRQLGSPERQKEQTSDQDQKPPSAPQSSRQSPSKQRHTSRKESTSSIKPNNPSEAGKSSVAQQETENEDDAFIEDETNKDQDTKVEQELNFSSNNNQALQPSPSRRSSKQSSPPASPSKRSSNASPMKSETNTQRRKSSTSPSKRSSVATPVKTDSISGSPRRGSSVVPPASPQKSVVDQQEDERKASPLPVPSPVLEVSKSEMDSQTPSEDSRSRTPSERIGTPIRTSSRQSELLSKTEESEPAEKVDSRPDSKASDNIQRKSATKSDPHESELPAEDKQTEQEDKKRIESENDANEGGDNEGKDSSVGDDYSADEDHQSADEDEYSVDQSLRSKNNDDNDSYDLPDNEKTLRS